MRHRWGRFYLGAAIAGTVFSVVSGGIGSIVVTVVVGAMYPQLRRTGRRWRICGRDRLKGRSEDCGRAEGGVKIRDRF